MADKLFRLEQIKEWDSATITRANLPAIELMERAAVNLSHFLIEKFPVATKLLFVCGTGNNGGDGLAMARLLALEGKSCTVFLTGKINSPDAEVNLQHLKKSDVVVLSTMPSFSDFDLIVDALIGSGLNKAPKGEFVEVIQAINESSTPVLSIDIPSGLPADGIAAWTCVEADVTATIHRMKRAFMLEENAHFVGELAVIDIGLDGLFEIETNTDWLLLKKSDFGEVFNRRGKFAHKGHFGHLAIIGGSEGMVGAATLATLAAMRSGVALTSVYTTDSGVNTVHAFVPEAMVKVAGQGAIKVFPEEDKYSAFAVGPGLGVRVDTAKHFAAWLNKVGKPVVVDADALNILSQFKEWLDRLPKNTILTPHPAEFDRLFGPHTTSLDRINTAVREAKKRKVIIVLKGAYTRIACPDGSLYFNPTGNPGMATAGSGDALTGVIGSLLAQGFEPKTAALAGVWLHGTSGDLAAKEKGEVGMIARDIIEQLPHAFRI